jgi:N utilization substance protein B
MQTLYASYLAQEANGNVTPDYKRSEKELFRRIHNAYQLYLYCLFYLVKTAEYLEVRESIAASKFLASDEEKQLNKKLLTNPITQTLLHKTKLDAQVENEELKPFYDKQVIQDIFDALQESTEYQDYLDQSTDLEAHKKMLNHTFYRVMLPTDSFQKHLEEVWITWLDDIQDVSN